MKSRLYSIVLLLAGAFHAHAEASPEMVAKLDKILKWPGSYSQICDANILPSPAPIPGFRSIVHGEAGLSEKNLDFLKANRAAILPAISAKLKSLDPLEAAVKQKPDPSIPKEEADVDPIGVDPGVYSTVLLEIIEALDAGEVFPELMEFEAKFLAALQKAEEDPKAQLPVVDGTDGAGMGMEGLLEEDEDWEKLSEKRLAEVERKSAVFSRQLAHRDMLAVFVRVMRKKGYEPMLESDLEKEYGALLKEKWSADEELSKYKKAADIPEDMRDSVKFDPVHKIAYLSWDPVHIPYTAEKRAAILKLTKQFVGLAPKAAAGNAGQ